MEVLKERLAKALAEQLCAEPEAAVLEVAQSNCYQALKKIRAVLDDDALDDAACFQKIEEIVSIFEDIGSNGGSRHDF